MSSGNEPLLIKWKDRVRAKNWILPTLMVGAAIGLSFIAVNADAFFKGRIEPVWWLFSGGQKIARQLLTAIAAAMIAIVTMALSITITALTFVAQHYGSRMVRSFMRDLTTQIAMGAFLSTFVYTLLVLRTVHNAPDDASLPRIAVTLGIVLATLSLGLLMYFLYHLSELMDAPNIVAAVARDLEVIIERTTAATPERGADDQAVRDDGNEASLLNGVEPEARTIAARATGYVQAIEYGELLALCRERDLILRVERVTGAFVVCGDALVSVSPAQRVRDQDTERIRHAVPVAARRSLEQDVEFGIDQFVQIAIRALSPGRNDTFTTMLCLDRLASTFSRLAERWPEATGRRDGDRLRIIADTATFPDMIERAFGQIRTFGGQSPVVAIRCLQTLTTIARRVRRPEVAEALRRQATAIHQVSRKSLEQEMDRDAIEREFQHAMQALEGSHHPASLSAT
jgi:uncharacterized membrane protein